jgi:uncharacterized protein with PIN domain
MDQTAASLLRGSSSLSSYAENAEEPGQEVPWVRSVTLRFYGELNDLLLPSQRGRAFVRAVAGPARVKDAMEASGVPHVEVDLIVRSGVTVGFEDRLKDGDRLAFYPALDLLHPDPECRLRPSPPTPVRFVADAHLRRLARILRLLGFDTLHNSRSSGEDAVGSAVRDARILLSRNRQLLRDRRLVWGRWIRSMDPLAQARETLQCFHLRSAVCSYTRCTICNGLLAAVDKSTIEERVPPRTAAWLDAYVTCTNCGRIYWHGTHAGSLERLIGFVTDEAN